ncbi:toxin-antitoxin system YwqK family antitoxin [Flavobacterium capsici]|uniref:Toxin-antitoxin system YwqK family antitoxin n=1 Tax=Flavobacterium capsici TaxID=3075618 RepID=A0AA96EZ07_9FLAO|nr:MULTISPECIES: hypothetical protein [unclassified Flavobacterium]WNM19467.1 hypothetical protein RN608_02010 [Flavobacterium sp. PMR2A8]WNM20856.1 hypothetical protein RN605_09180 [Flavobacterium sp. PMTSA4]
MTSKTIFSIFLFFSLYCNLQFITETPLRKKIVDKDFKYEFYVTKKIPEIRANRTYYWFKGGAIHTSEYGISGEVLNDDFEKFYLNNQIAEKGKFNKGLKVGVWKNWHPNGKLSTYQYYDEGIKNGAFYKYNENGILVEKGKYRRDKKQGEWINLISKDTVVFKKGEVFVSKEKTKTTKEDLKKKEGKTKPNFFKRLFHKKNKPTKENETSKSKKDNVNPREKEKSKEGKGFFKRLFSKKQKTDDQLKN